MWPNLVILRTIYESNFFLKPIFPLKKFDLGSVNYFIYAMVIDDGNSELVSFWLVMWTRFSTPGWRVLCNAPMWSAALKSGPWGIRGLALPLTPC